MFDDNALRKAQREMQELFDATVEQINGSFDKAFASLPDKIKKAFDAKDVRLFQSSVKNIAADFMHLRASAEEVEKQQRLIVDHAQKLQKTILEQINGLQEKNKEEQDVVKALMSQSRVVDQLLEAEEYGHELRKKNLQQRVELMGMLDNVNAAIEAGNAKQEEYNALLGQQYKNQQMNIIAQHLFGTNMNNITNQSNYIIGLWKNTSVWTKAALAVGLIGEQLINTFKVARNAGQEAGQSVFSSWNAGLSSLGSMMKGVFISPTHAAENQGILQNLFGTVDIPRELTETGNLLTSQFKLSGDEAGRFLNFLQRADHFQTHSTTQTVDQLRTIARMRGMAPHDMFEDLANNTEYWASMLGKGADTIGRITAELHQMNLTGREALDWSESLVQSPEAMFQRFAQIRQIGMLLGKNIDTRQLARDLILNPQQAEGNFVNQLHRQGITQERLNQLPFPLQNMAMQAFGMNRERFTTIGAAPATAAPDQTKLISNTTSNWLNSIGDFVTSLRGATAAVWGLAIASFAASGFKGISKLLGLAKGAIGLAGVGGGAAAATAAETGLGGGTAAVSGAGVGAMAGMAAASIPAAVGMGVRQWGYGQYLGGTASQLISAAAQGVPGLGPIVDNYLISKNAPKMTPKTPAAAQMTAAQDMAQHQEAAMAADTTGGQSTAESVASVMNTTAVERKLDELIRLFKSGQIKMDVELDGKKVGYGVLEAFSRG